MEKIARQGFAALQLSVSDALVTTLAQQAYNNPCLMQDYCLKLCGVIERKIKLSEQVIIDEIFVAAVSGHKRAFAHDEISGVSGAHLKHNDRTATLLKVFYLALSQHNMYQIFSRSGIVAEMKSLCKTAPSDAAIGKAISAANKVVNLDREDDLAFRITPKGDGLYIVNSWFLVYLRWLVRESYGMDRVGESLKL